MAESSTDDRREAVIRKVQELQAADGGLTPAQRQEVLASFPGLTESELIPLEAEAYYRSIR
jgi:hypothetical protein